MSAPAGYTQLPTTGEYMKDSDSSGPYVFSGTAMTLAGTGTGSGGGGGDASAANQTTQITAEQAIQAGVGAVADAAATAGSTGSLSAKLRLVTTQLASVITGLGTVVIAAGTALIGKVGIDQTVPGTTNKVSIGTDGVLAAGTALIGKVGLDQTTPGTTNAVAPISGQVGVAGGSGANGATVQRVTIATDDAVMGGTADAAATAGSTGSISAKLRALSRDLVANIVLAAGGNLIGKVGLDQTTNGTTNKVVSSAIGYRVRTAITRPANATPYTALDVVGGALDLGVVGPASGHVLLTSLDLIHEVTAIPSGMTSFRLYLYSATPPSAIADNSAFAFGSTDLSVFIGYVDLGVIALPITGAYLFSQVDNVLKQVVCDASGHLYGYLVTTGAWTPGANSTVFDLTVRTMGV